MDKSADRCSAVPALEVRGITARFGNFYALSGVNLSVDPGELRVLIGANGAGKSTLLDVICGKTKATSGEVAVQGGNITNLTETQIVHRNVGRKFQVPAIFPDLTVEEHLELARRLRGSLWRDLGRRVRGIRDERVAECLEQIGLADDKDRIAGELSHGQHQWLELGMLLVQEPALLLLDEPTAGMTAAETTKTANLISTLRGKHALVVVEHDMAFVRDICEKITVLHQGQVLCEGSAKEVENDPAVIEAYLGSSEVAHA